MRPRTITARHTLHAAIALTSVICALLLAACGSSSSKATAAATRGQGQLLAFSKCMRAHGVTNFPDPNGQGLRITPSMGINPFSPSFKAAQASCRHILPFGGPGGNGHPSAQAKAQMLAISVCMRAHGVSGFPDPTTTPPSGPGNGAGVVLGRGGVFLEVPSTIDMQSPAFKQAAQTCGFPGGPPGAK
jgi:hypothetical protein